MRSVESGQAFRSPEEFRDWLKRNHASAAELVVRCFKTACAERGVTYSYESTPRALTGAFLKRFRSRPRAWRFFQSQPEGYRRTCVFWVLSAKGPATRESRFAVLLASSVAGERIPLLRREAPRRASGRRAPD